MDERWMRMALEQARLAFREGEAPVGCVIVRNDELLAAARNDRQARRDPTGHAEINAIRAAAEKIRDWRLTACTMYVTLEPCPMCAGAIQMARLGRLVYGAPDPAQGCAGSVYRITEDPAFAHFCPAEGGVLAEECGALLTDFFRGAR